MIVRRRLLCLLAGMLAVSGCTMPRPWKLPSATCNGSPSPVASSRVLTVSFRLPVCSDDKVTFSNWRSETPQYGEVLPWPARPAQPQTRLVSMPAFDAARGTSAIVYVHGYNNSHAVATRRATAISALVDDRVPVIALTWPSYGSAPSFAWDEANNEWAREPALRELERIVGENGKIILVAHSMGSRLVLDALARSPRLRERVTQLIMAAPDVDREQMSRAIGEHGGLSMPITIYVSTRDQPLSASWRFHGYPRGGDRSYWVSGRKGYIPFTTRPGVRVIDLSQVRGDMFHHANFIESWQGASHLCHLLSGLAGPRESRIARDYAYFQLDEILPVENRACDDRAKMALSRIDKRIQPGRGPSKEVREPWLSAPRSNGDAGKS